MDSCVFFFGLSGELAILDWLGELFLVTNARSTCGKNIIKRFQKHGFRHMHRRSLFQRSPRHQRGDQHSRNDGSGIGPPRDFHNMLSTVETTLAVRRSRPMQVEQEVTKKRGMKRYDQHTKHDQYAVNSLTEFGEYRPSHIAKTPATQDDSTKLRLEKLSGLRSQAPTSSVQSCDANHCLREPKTRNYLRWTLNTRIMITLVSEESLHVKHRVVCSTCNRGLVAVNNAITTPWARNSGEAELYAIGSGSIDP